MDYIQGEKFRELSDNHKIYYCDTHDVNRFFETINFTHDFILISHNSDGKITNNPTREFDADSKKIPKNLKKWYGQNVCVSDERIISLPIGLENSMWFREIGKINQMVEKSKTDKNIKNLLYVNHNILTNPQERTEPYQLFQNKDYVKCVNGFNGMDFQSYLDDIYNHEFVLCPEGNGTDTHRTWECLYLGTIPIEKRNTNNSYYSDLPICFVDKWDEINEDFLKKEYNRIKNTIFSLDKLDFNYWKKTITDEIRNFN
jgi:hypothetical protein